MSKEEMKKMFKGEYKDVNLTSGVMDLTCLELPNDDDDDEIVEMSEMDIITIGNYLLDAREAINKVLSIVGIEESDGSELEGIVKI